MLLNDDGRALMFQLVIAKPMQPTGTQDMSVDITEAQADLVLRRGSVASEKRWIRRVAGVIGSETIIEGASPVVLQQKQRLVTTTHLSDDIDAREGSSLHPTPAHQHPRMTDAP